MRTYTTVSYYWSRRRRWLQVEHIEKNESTITAQVLSNNVASVMRTLAIRSNAGDSLRLSRAAESMNRWKQALERNCSALFLRKQDTKTFGAKL